MRGVRGAAQNLAREILIALPDTCTDLYRNHQIVWEHVAQAVPYIQATDFLYRIDGGMVRVRSKRFDANCSNVAALNVARPVFVDLAAVKGQDHSEPVAQVDLLPWCGAKLAQAGLLADSLSILDYEVRRGTKTRDGRLMDIRIPVVRVSAKVSIVDTQTSDKAWITGIGRGRRFGLGMLAH
jgi:hypothetical protein